MRSSTSSPSPRAATKSAPHLSPSTPHVLEGFLGDAARVRQVLINLIGNAVKFTEAGEVTLSTSPPPRSSNNVYRRRVSSSPIPAWASQPKALVEALFQPFQQGDASATRKYGGTGLGLTITKRLVELMQRRDRRLERSSAPARSSFRFTLCLPACTIWTVCVLGGQTASRRASLVIVGRDGNYPIMLKKQLEGSVAAKVLGVVDPATPAKMTDTNITAVLWTATRTRSPSPRRPSSTSRLEQRSRASYFDFDGSPRQKTAPPYSSPNA